ncbi:threonine synthase [Kutzneria albida]|uniref:Pyridoxal-5'-phosphate-dependent protein subunitbeta n=1 Tax=Kutzneria albida DSM 43870 TaxID=1449976 RepID=W5W313_9PSEU|nr:pyridoxal-phosphate dependent enzyme [Kutzneria albida]AHH95237.1 pyridoxal-5'-phosphate-dependent protein subunitbeta [Kutzneria albida DSM 43870]
MSRARYVDPVDGSVYPLDAPRWRSDAGRPLMVTPQAGISREDVERAERSLWRYRACLPVEIARPISLGEGCTPLVERSWGGARPLFKLEWFSPTGSFKDRGTSVMLSYLRQHGITSVLEDSSGNGGSSVAGYGAAGGVAVRILAPAATSPAKIAQVAAYGAEVQLVAGPREESQAEAIRQSDRIFYAGHNWQALFLEGVKTLAYELWEDLGYRAPDNLVVPVGAGSSLLGCHLGFRELLAAGQITRLPRLFAAQPLNCSPVDASFAAGADGPVDRVVRPTIAEGTAIPNPLRLRQMLTALRDSGGGSVAIPEQDIVTALGELCGQGLFVEPTSATAAAAVTRLVAEGRIAPEETTVVVLSGSGLKAAAAVRDLLDTTGRPS